MRVDFFNEYTNEIINWLGRLNSPNLSSTIWAISTLLQLNKNFQKSLTAERRVHMLVSL